MTTTAAARLARRLYSALALALGALVAVALAVPAAALPPPTLASTPETDLADPFLIAKAAELGHDPAAIFAFVRDDIALRGLPRARCAAPAARSGAAPGTAPTRRGSWSVCCACRVPARWVRGPLPEAQAKLLIESMFPRCAG